VNKSKYLSHLIDLNFKPKYDKCDGPEMNTIKKIALPFSHLPNTNIPLPIGPQISSLQLL
jgi:hypothetical protein